MDPKPSLVLKFALREHLNNGKLSEHQIMSMCSQMSSAPKDDPEVFGVIADVCFTLKSYDKGISLLSQALNSEHIKSTIDLTFVYFALGRIYHFAGRDRHETYSLYFSATQAEAPLGCISPASQDRKALAHLFAFNSSNLLQLTGDAEMEEYARYHDEMRRYLAPNLNWDDRTAVTRWQKALS